GDAGEGHGRAVPPVSTGWPCDRAPGPHAFPGGGPPCGRGLLSAHGLHGDRAPRLRVTSPLPRLLVVRGRPALRHRDRPRPRPRPAATVPKEAAMALPAVAAGVAGACLLGLVVGITVVGGVASTSAGDSGSALLTVPLAPSAVPDPALLPWVTKTGSLCPAIT